MPGQYITVNGVRYERDLYEYAKTLADQKKEIDKETAEKLWTMAMDGNKVTETERKTLQHILEQNAWSAEARTLLEGRLDGSDTRSPSPAAGAKKRQYQMIKGERYERDLVEFAKNLADQKKEIDEEAAKNLWEMAMDGNRVTDTERKTLEYILKEYGFNPEAKALLEERIAEYRDPKKAKTQ